MFADHSESVDGDKCGTELNFLDGYAVQPSVAGSSFITSAAESSTINLATLDQRLSFAEIKYKVSIGNIECQSSARNKNETDR